MIPMLYVSNYSIPLALTLSKPFSSFVLRFKTDLMPIIPKFWSCCRFGCGAEIRVSVIGINFATGSLYTKNRSNEIEANNREALKRIHLLILTIC